MSIFPPDPKRSEPFSAPQARQRNPSSDHGSSPSGSRQNRRLRGSPPTAGQPVLSSSSPPVVFSFSGDNSHSRTARNEVSSNSSEKVAGFLIPRSDSLLHMQNTGSISGSKSEIASENAISSVNVDSELSSVYGMMSMDEPIQPQQQATGRVLHPANVILSGARKNQPANANHLLNFYYEPISQPQDRPRPPPPRRQRKIKPYNKDLFLQANYKFVVLGTGSHDIDTMDPDKMLQWEDIICVRYYTVSPVNCPICLESPLCPQITSCGHIYCFPCILHYLLMGREDCKGESWKKCPLCFTLISAKELYSIYIIYVKELCVGEPVTFSLLSRSKLSLVPSLTNNDIDGDATGVDDEDAADLFSKFIMTSDVELSVRESKLELSHWLAKADSGLVDDLEKLPYVSAAIEHLEERTKCLMELHGCNQSPPKSDSRKASDLQSGLFCKEQGITSNSVDGNLYGDSPFPARAECHVNTEQEKLCYKGEPNNKKTHCSLESRSPSKPELSTLGVKTVGEQLSGNTVIDVNSYTFYQAADGQYVILHPLNMKCLLHHYGNLNLLPPRLTGNILELETVTQSEAMRKRYRFLSHFSLTTTFQFCEIDLSELLPPSSLCPFMDEIRKREKQRRMLARKEQKGKDKAEFAYIQESMIPCNVSHTSHANVAFSLDDFEALGSPAVSSNSAPTSSERTRFSDVIRLGFASAHDSPSLRADSVASTVNTESVNMHPATGSAGTATMSFARILSSSRSVESPETLGSSGSIKKGKKPTRVLLSTSGGRRY